MQKTLRDQYFKVEVLERALNFKELSQDEREKMERELDAIKTLLVQEEHSLKELQRQSRQSPMVAVVLVVLCFAVYCIYSLF